MSKVKDKSVLFGNIQSSRLKISLENLISIQLLESVLDEGVFLYGVVLHSAALYDHMFGSHYGAVLIFAHCKSPAAVTALNISISTHLPGLVLTHCDHENLKLSYMTKCET